MLKPNGFKLLLLVAGATTSMMAPVKCLEGSSMVKLSVL